MTWTATTPDTCVAPDALSDVDALTLATDAQKPSEAEAQQLDFAKVAAKSIIGSYPEGAVAFRTGLSGHADDDGAGSTGFVAVSVTVSTPATTPPAPVPPSS